MTSTENITEAVFVGVSEAATERNINIVSVIAGSACAMFVVVVLIIVIVLKKRVTRRRESVPTLRPGNAAGSELIKKVETTTSVLSLMRADDFHMLMKRFCFYINECFSIPIKWRS